MTFKQKFIEMMEDEAVFIDKHGPDEPSIKEEFLPLQPVPNQFKTSVTEFYRLIQDDEDEPSIETQFKEWQDLADYPDQVIQFKFRDDLLVSFAKGDRAMEEPDGEVINIACDHRDLSTDQLEQCGEFETFLFQLIYKHICDMLETTFTSDFEIISSPRPGVTYYQVWLYYQMGHS